MRALLLTLVFWAFVFGILFVVIAFGVRWGLSMWWNSRCDHQWEPVTADGVQCSYCRKQLRAYKVRSQLARQASAHAAEQPARDA
jgi:hypothetical protein